MMTSESVSGEMRHPLHLDDQLSSGVTLFPIPDRIWDFAQRVGTVDDRSDLSCLDEIFQNNQALELRHRNKSAQVLAQEW